MANDTDADNDKLTVTLEIGAKRLGDGEWDGTITYDPNANFNGTDTFKYTISDGTLTDTATVTVTVNAINDPPVAVNDKYSTAEDTPLVVPAPGVLVNDTDVDGGTLTATLTTGPANGTLVFNSNGGFTYTPNANFNGTDSFTYSVDDGTGGTDLATVDITVTPLNDAPVAAGQTQTTDEDTATGRHGDRYGCRRGHVDVCQGDRPDAGQLWSSIPTGLHLHADRE